MLLGTIINSVMFSVLLATACNGLDKSAVDCPVFSRQVTGKCPLTSVCFALDESGSISSTEFVQEKSFVVELAKEIAKVTQSTFYSAVGFTTMASVIQSRTKKLTSVFIPAVQNRVKISGGTASGTGLRLCFDEIKNDDQKVIVLLSDGVDGGTNRGVDVAADNKKADNNVAIVTVGIGSSVNEADLKNIATRPDFFVKVANFSDLANQVFNTTQDICGAISVIASPSPEMKDPCKEAFNECKLTFKGRKGKRLATFSIKKKSGKKFTPIVVFKGNVPFGSLKKKQVMAKCIRDDEKVRPLSSLKSYPKLKATSIQPTTSKDFSLKPPKLSYSQLHALKGKCIMVAFDYGKKFKQFKKVCLVFRLK